MSEEPQLSHPRVWTIVGLLCLGFTIAYVDRTNLSIALASEQFRRAFGFSDSERGLLNSAFFWSYALLQVPAGIVTDRFGVKLPYAISFFTWSLVSAATAFTENVWQLFALRIVLGAAEAIVTPASLKWITTHVEERHRGLAAGILFAGAKFGPAAGAKLAVELINSSGWRGMFLILGLGSMLFLVPWMWLVKERRTPLPVKTSVAVAGNIWRSTTIYGILIGTVAYNYFNYFNLTWLPAYFVEHWHLPLAKMGSYTAFSFLGMAAMAIAGGAVADSFIRKGADPVLVRKAFTIAGLLIASTEIVGSLTTSREVAVTFAFISMAGLGLTTANYWALTQTLMPGAAIGKISGIQNLASNLAGVAAPALTGWLIQTTGSYSAPMQAILIVLVAGILAYTFLVPHRKRLQVTMDS